MAQQPGQGASSGAANRHLLVAGERKKTVCALRRRHFYESFPKSITRRSMLFNGIRMRELVIPSPSFPDPFAAETLHSCREIVQTSPRPYASLPCASEHRDGTRAQRTGAVHRVVSLSAALHLYRSRDVNAPLPDAGVRPNSDLRKVTSVESTGSMRSNAVDVGLRWNSKRFTGMAQYTFSRTRDDAFGLFTAPANSYDLRPEWWDQPATTAVTSST